MSEPNPIEVARLLLRREAFLHEVALHPTQAAELRSAAESLPSGALIDGITQTLRLFAEMDSPLAIMAQMALDGKCIVDKSREKKP